MITLVIRYPDGTEQEAELAGQLTVGRADGNDLVLAEGGVSRKHARFFTQGQEVMVEDTGSANGTWVDGEKIGGPTRLQARAQVVIGDYEISLKANGAKAVRRAPAAGKTPIARDAERATTAGPPVNKARATKVVPAVKGGAPSGAAALARRPRPAPGPQASTGPVLRGLTGPWLNKTFPLKGTMVVGRVPGVDVQLDDDSVSRRHAEVVVQGRDVVLRDLGSANGTNVNGAPLTEELALAPGDIIQFGVVEMTFEVPQAVARRDAAGRAGRPVSTTDEPGRADEPGAQKSKRLLIAGGVVLGLLVVGVCVKVLFFLPPPPVNPDPGGSGGPQIGAGESLDQLLEIARSNASPDMAEPNWDKALDAVNRALELEPIHSEANELKRRVVKERACKEAYDKGIKAMRLREDEALEAFSKIGDDCSYFFKVKPKIKEAVEQVMKKSKEDCETYSGNGAWREALPRCQKYMDFACQDMPREALYPAATQVMCIGAGARKRGCFMPKDKTYVKFLTARDKIDPGAPLWQCPELPIFKKAKPPIDPGAAAKGEIRKRLGAEREIAEALVLYFDGRDAEATNVLQRLLEQNGRAASHAQARLVQRDIAEVMGLFRSGQTELQKEEPEHAEEPFREALAVDERLVLGPEKAAKPEAEKKTDLDRFKSYVRKNVQHDMASAAYEKGRYWKDRNDDKRACKIWRMGFSFYRGDSNLLRAVTNVCTQHAHDVLEGASDCASLARVYDFEVPGDGTREEVDRRRTELKCPPP